MLIYAGQHVKFCLPYTFFKLFRDFHPVRSGFFTRPGDFRPGPPGSCRVLPGGAGGAGLPQKELCSTDGGGGDLLFLIF